MKKFLTLLIVFLGLIILICGYIEYKNQPTKEQINQQTDSRIDSIQSELEKYQDKEREDELRRAELLAMQNPEIITNELSNVGNLIVYEGKITYSSLLRDSKWYGTKELNVELHYNFGIGIDISKITVQEFLERQVILNIPKSELTLQYLELNASESKLESVKTWLQSNYTSNDSKFVLEQGYSSTKQRIESSKDIFDAAMVNLKDVVSDLVVRLGYDGVIFNED